jgi:hypothetical protein
MVVGASCTPPFRLQGLCRLCRFCVLLIHLGSPLTRFWSHVSKAVVAPSVVVNDIVVVTSPSMASHEGLRDPKANDGDQAACGLSPPKGWPPPGPFQARRRSAAAFSCYSTPSVMEDSLLVSVVDVSLELSGEDSLSTPEIRLHIAINVISSLNATEEFRSLSVDEISLCEFLLDQMLLL